LVGAYGQDDRLSSLRLWFTWLTTRKSVRSTTPAQLISAQRGAYSDLDLRRALRNSIFSQTSEPSSAARLGYGVAIKRYGGGATIGEFSSAQDMEVIDLGVLLLSMHYRFMLTFYRS
jgi:hypothetical protein